MKDTMFSLPESYLYYMQPQHYTAFDQIDGRKKPPANFTWDDIQEYHKAKFSLDVIKYETYRFSCELWDKTWGYSIHGDQRFVPCMAEAYAKENAALSIDEVWNDCLVRLFRQSTLVHWFGISPDTGEGSIKLYWYATAENTGIVSSSQSLPPEKWEKDITEYDYRTTKNDLLPITYNVPTYDCFPLRDAATELIEICRKEF